MNIVAPVLVHKRASLQEHIKVKIEQNCSGSAASARVSGKIIKHCPAAAIVIMGDYMVVL
jgi:hypothetical protein